MMLRSFRVLIPVIVAFGGIAAHASTGGTPCAELISLTIPNVVIQSAALLPAGTFTPAGARAKAPPLNLPQFCRVVAIARPSSDSLIHLEVWIPSAAAWNGKFEGVGTGAFLGAISYADMADGLRRGYATASTDMGHSGDDLKFADGHPEKIVDWSYRAIHVTTETAKLIIRDQTGRLPQYSYFDGCNTGGQQGLSEAQRYPEDYDGIVAGDPAADRIHEIAGYVWAWGATHKDGVDLLSPAKLRLVTKSALAACDALDGVTDGVIEDPRRCHFDPGTLTCHGAETNECLTPDQVDAVKKVYAGLRNPRTGEQIFPGWSVGSEGYGASPNEGWGRLVTGGSDPRRNDFFKYVVFNDASWDWRTMDFDKDVAYADAKVGFVSATDPDLRKFQSGGGKLLMYTGWVDPILPPEDVVDYYDAVTKMTGGPEKTQGFLRLFMVPGMAHCEGGPGTAAFDMLPELEQWVEKGVAPKRIIAARVSNGVTERTRPLCAYPQVAKWSGRGSTDDAANFACVSEGRPPAVSPAQRK